MSGLSYIPGWRDDETVYSWCCHYHAILGNHSARLTGALLFGEEHACRERSAPLHLKRLASRASGALGSAISMLRARTPVALFWPFLDAAKRTDVERLVEADAGVGWMTTLGMPASTLNATGLRYCGACVAQDMGDFGVPRWRLSHQIAGAWVCAEHGKALSVLRSRASAWILPTCSATDEGVALERAMSSEDVRQLTRVAIFGVALTRAETVDIPTLRSGIVALLRDRGVVGWAFPLNKERLARWFSSTPLAGALRRLVTAEQRLADGAWIHDLLRGRCAEHPLRWMLLWAALHDGTPVDQMESAFFEPAARTVAWDIDGQGSLWPSTQDAIAAQLTAYVSRAVDIKTAARQLGMSTCALRRQINVDGVNARDVAATMSRERRRRQCIANLHAFIDEHPGCSRTDVHKRCRSAVGWLERQAPDDLRRVLEMLPTKRGQQYSLPLQ